MALKPEEIERRFVARWNKEYSEKRYFRFNVEQGLQKVVLTEYSKEKMIESATYDYLHQGSQKSCIRDCILNLIEKEGTIFIPDRFLAFGWIAKIPQRKQGWILRRLYEKASCLGRGSDIMNTENQENPTDQQPNVSGEAISIQG
ncbi:hypothetical protein N7509_004396 [Penicillium cosmopolitanum]|uniref:Uncharacterized protein n=1 Tax=Penicillium cosmopolitanum TaxID=1131564 RepID=A0A9W9W6W3_9EURO|nr:uncharacterized protein N7509_004396 [Penicillium cosmopolitanum]KAJ5404525.1 hypothetical protein N7509_004396 [Penicillium cosmopolitanum]